MLAVVHWKLAGFSGQLWCKDSGLPILPVFSIKLILKKTPDQPESFLPGNRQKANSLQLVFISDFSILGTHTELNDISVTMPSKCDHLSGFLFVQEMCAELLYTIQWPVLLNVHIIVYVFVFMCNIIVIEILLDYINVTKCKDPIT